MSKWRKPLKNKRRFDARYFLNETVVQQEVIENSVQQERLKKSFHDFSFDSWITEEAKPDFLDIDNDGDKEESMKKAADEVETQKEAYDHQDKDVTNKKKVAKKDLEEGHDGATKGHSEEEAPTKKRMKDPFDYEEDGKVGGKVVEEGETTVIGDEEEEPSYGEPPKEADEIEEA
jgi:hypothetical protein